ncbi:hypothetical protein B0H16DRAFT_1711398 [Mycena metata]|uniref:Uncharacterized protein n=1 Tax=Mycena metata TaxID=1033252 RepID=A0AAD7NWT8_9AGAR|nr:hypothetical protein B0H16DRAFT_1711398 [Mycena metata]
MLPSRAMQIAQGRSCAHPIRYPRFPRPQSSFPITVEANHAGCLHALPRAELTGAPTRGLNLRGPSTRLRADWFLRQLGAAIDSSAALSLLLIHAACLTIPRRY